MKDFDVLVAGGGPAGSATAFHLARSGLRVLVVDRARFPRDKACSEYMGPETVRLLDRLGVLSALEATGCHYPTGTTVVGSNGSRLTGSFALAGRQPFRSTGLSLPRRLLDQSLVNAARSAGAVIREQTRVVDLLSEGGAITGALLRTESGEPFAVSARLTVGADGLRSIVARRIGRRRYGRPCRIALVAHVAEIESLTGPAELHVGPKGYAGLNAIGNGVTNVALVLPKTLAVAARGRVREFFFEQLSKFPGIRGRVHPARLVREVLVTGPFAAWSGRVTSDGALLVGDAADFFDPFTGEGIYSALLGAELAAATAREALSEPHPVTNARLSGYRAARRRAFAGKWAVERLIGYGMLMPTLFDRAVGRLGRRGLAHTMIGVTGDFVPAWEILNPLFLARMVV